MFVILFLILNIINENNCDNNFNLEFSCWFTTFNTTATINKRIINLVIGYNSNITNETFIAISDTSNLISPLNLIYPYQFNGLQPDLFNNGDFPYSFIIIDSNNSLLSNQSNYIQWTLNTSTLLINSTLINNNTLCYNSYHDDCVVNISNFCDDNIYCNGEEYCYSPFGLDIGSCLHIQQNITPCSSLNMMCNETSLTCYNNTDPPPTSISPTSLSPTSLSPTSLSPTSSSPTSLSPTSSSPTSSSPTSSSPTSSSPTSTSPTSSSPTSTSPTSLSPTLDSSSSPTTIISEDGIICNNNNDCSIYNNFCQGDYICNSTLHLCLPFDSNYNPCNNGNILEIFKNQSNIGRGESPISIVCVEHLNLCVESFICNNDNDCQDNLICNGNERCIDGICQFASNLSLSSICGIQFDSIPSNKLLCSEIQGCFVIQSDDPGSTIASQVILGFGIAIPVTVLIIMIIVFTYIIIKNRHMLNKFRKKK